MVLFCHTEWFLELRDVPGLLFPILTLLSAQKLTHRTAILRRDNSTGTKFKGDQNLFSRMNRNRGNRNTHRSLSMKDQAAVNLDASHVDLIPLHQQTSQHTPSSVVRQKHAPKLAISLPPSGHSLAGWPAPECCWVLGDLPSYPQTLPNFFSGGEQKSIYFFGSCQGQGCVCVFSLTGTTFQIPGVAFLIRHLLSSVDSITCSSLPSSI